jgi:hypothetical protein
MKSHLKKRKEKTEEFQITQETQDHLKQPQWAKIQGNHATQQENDHQQAQTGKGTIWHQVLVNHSSSSFSSGTPSRSSSASLVKSIFMSSF